MTLEKLVQRGRGGRSVLGAAAAALVLLSAGAASAQDPAAPPAATKRAPRAATRPAPAKAKPPVTAAEEPAAAAEADAADQVDDQGDDVDAEAEDAAAAEAQADEAAEAEDEVVVDEEPAPRAAPRTRHRQSRGGADHHHHRHDHRTRRTRTARRAPAAPPPPPAYAAPPPSYWAMPYEMEYVEGAEVPDGYRKDTRVRKGLVIGGAITFGTTWLLSALAATVMVRADDEPDYAYDGSTYRTHHDRGIPGAAALYIPIAGPFVAIHTLDADSGGAALLFVDGLAQAAGFSMFVAGLAAKKTVLVKTPQTSVALAPSAPGTPSGASLVGSF